MTNPAEARALPAMERALLREAASHPLERKIVVAARRGVGRELLRRVALETGGWVGFEATTPRALAIDLVAAELADRRWRYADEFDELAMIDASIDAALSRRGSHVLRRFVEGAGLRDAMAHSIRALRLAGIDSAVLGRAGFRDRAKREAVGRVLDHYERLLRKESVTDTAGVVRLAASALEAGAVELPQARYYLVPGQSRRGVVGRLLDRLAGSGAVVLEDDPVHGLSGPAARLASPGPTSSGLSWLHAVEQAGDATAGQVELFAAGSVADEVREVLRRAVALDLRWDEIEIVATDPITYGTALDAVARRLGIPVSYAAGLPIGRTRPGRAVEAWLRWVGDDFPADVLHDLIERGDIAAPGSERTSGHALARRLRPMLIGRGRDRYTAALERAGRAARRTARDEDRSPAELEAARAAEERELAELRALTGALFEALPLLPDRNTPDATGPTPASLARGLLAFLSLVPLETSEDRTAHDRLAQRVRRLADTATRPTTLKAAIAIIAAKLDARVPGPAGPGEAPWTSDGGRLHLSDIEHGGHTGRRATFVVGLDSVRFPGTAIHDTLLNDEDRRRLVPEAPFSAIPTTAERLEERRFALASLLARLRGRITLSYSAWEASEARNVAPASEMLQAFRLLRRDPTIDYDALHEALGRYASAIPSAARLDATDVWFGALARDGVLAAGLDVVRQAYPGLDAGLAARTARDSGEFTAHHGRIRPRPERLDPRDDPDLEVSAKRLEALGTCPHRYLLRHVLGVDAVEEPEFRPDRWLAPKERGRLLHRLYEESLRRAKDRSCGVLEPAFEDLTMAVLDEVIDEERDVWEPPGEAVFQLEYAALREEARLFVEMVRRTGAPWVELECWIGPTPIELPGGVIRLVGKIDRIDQPGAEAPYVVIDYKTGSADGFGRSESVFDGGRRLQHALYVAAARRRFGRDVARAEFHFPTNRGETRVVAFEERSLRRARSIIDGLLELVRKGHFFPTDEAEDCRFCKYRQVCRVRIGSRVDSPLAAWSLKQRRWLPELALLEARSRNRI